MERICKSIHEYISPHYLTRSCFVTELIQMHKSVLTILSLLGCMILNLLVSIQDITLGSICIVLRSQITMYDSGIQIMVHGPDTSCRAELFGPWSSPQVQNSCAASSGNPMSINTVLASLSGGIHKPGDMAPYTASDWHVGLVCDQTWHAVPDPVHGISFVAAV